MKYKKNDDQTTTTRDSTRKEKQQRRTVNLAESLSPMLGVGDMPILPPRALLGAEDDAIPSAGRSGGGWKAFLSSDCED
jgi:hypothetical protein